MITTLLLSACLLAAPTAPPAGQTAGQTTAAPPKKGAAAPAAKPAAKPSAADAAKPAAAPPAAPGPEAPKGLIALEVKRGRLEFSHKVHAQTACDQCHKGQAVPARIGVKGVEAAHKFCVDCHKAGKKGPEKCSWCHKRS